MATLGAHVVTWKTPAGMELIVRGTTYLGPFQMVQYTMQKQTIQD